MKYVTVKMIAAHAGRTVQGVNHALKRAGVHPGRTPGVHGIRIPLKAANQFLAHQWPTVAPMGQEEAK